MLSDRKGKKIRLGVDDVLSDTPMMSAWLTKPTLGLDVDATGPTLIAPLASCCEATTPGLPRFFR
jgi:hypothetical protein